MNQLRIFVIRRKEKKIQKLLTLRVYKIEERHLFEILLIDLEEEYKQIRTRKGSQLAFLFIRK